MIKGILKLLIVSLCISALIGIFIILNGGSLGEIEGRVLGTISAIFGFSITGLCCSSIYDKEKHKLFSSIGMSTCLLGCLWLMLMIWGVFDECITYRTWTSCSPSDSTFQMLWMLILLSCSFAHISLMLLLKKTNLMVANVKNVTIILSVVMDSIILAIIWEWIDNFDSYWRSLAVVSILITLGTIIAPVLNKVAKNKA